MLFLMFQLGSNRYVLDARKVVEVLPLVRIEPAQQAPKCVAGFINYRGTPVPAVDLCELLLGRPAAPRMSTRIVLISLATESGERKLIGLIAEGAIGLIRKERSEFIEPGMRLNNAPYLGPVAMDKHGVIYWVQEQRLLPAQVHDALFNRPDHFV